MDYCCELFPTTLGKIFKDFRIRFFSSAKTPSQSPPIDNNAAAAQVLDSYGNSILRLAYSYLHNMSDAEDVLQDTLIKYLEHGFIPENEKHEKAWLMKVAANLSKNRINYNNIRKYDELDESLAAEHREDLSFVWDAVRQLPEQFREVIHLFYYEGFSTREISYIVKRKESSVRSDLHRGRAKLKEILAEEYDFE